MNFVQNVIEKSLSRLSPYVDEIIGDHQCGFRRNRSTTDQIFLHSSNTGEEMGAQ
jgi:hypothetical protein